MVFNISAQQKYTADWASIDNRPVPQWFTDAKFGIFIHWGLYSVPAWAPILPGGHGGERFSEWYWYWLRGTQSPAYLDFHNKANGEAIYETVSWSVAEQSDVNAYFTAKGKDLYVIFTKYPGKEVTIRDVPGKPSSVTLLGSGSKVKHSYRGKDVTLTPPVLSPAGYTGEYAWVFKFEECL